MVSADSVPNNKSYLKFQLHEKRDSIFEKYLTIIVNSLWRNT